MADDIFDHPDLRGPEWDRLARESARKYRPPKPPRQRSAFWAAHRRKVLALGALVGLVVAGTVVVGQVRRGAEDSRGSGAEVTTTARADVKRVDLAQPFVGTPAAGWADGAAGVVVPVATAVGGLSAEQVSAATGLVRRALVAAHLDPEVIHGRDLAPLAEVFAQNARDDIRDKGAFRTRLAPGFPLLDAQPKVSGTMTVEAGAQRGELVVHTKYAFAYAFAPTDPETIRDPMDIVAVSRFDTDFAVMDAASFEAADAGLWPVKVGGYTYSIACTAFAAGFIAPTFSEHRTDITDAQDGDRYFDVNAPLATESTC